jgi:hypothetical protein
VLKSCIWDNEWFKIGGKEIHYNKWRRVGIHFVSDLVHIEENRLLSLQEVRDKYGLNTNFLEYNSVLRAIKDNFKHFFSANANIIPMSRPFIPFHLSFILKDKKGCKSLCKRIMTFKVPKSRQNWERN